MFPMTSLLMVTATSLFLSATPLRIGSANDLAAPGGPPRVQLAGISSGDLSRKALLADPMIHLSGCVPSARVTGFVLTHKNTEGVSVTYRTKEQRLSKQMIEAISAMSIGSSFTITELSVVDDQGKSYKVPEASFVLRV